MTDEHRSIELSGRSRCWHRGFSELTTAEQTFRAIWDLEAQVNNGGFDQYFFNSTGDWVRAAVDGLVAIGAGRATQVVREAMQVFAGGEPSVEQSKRRARLVELGRHREAAFERVDAAFLAYPDDLSALLFRFVKAHAAEIDGARECGF